MSNPHLHNPHLEGDPFFWKAGPIGIFLSHGYTATTAEVRLLARQLHERGFSVAAPLLPGHGTQPEDLNSVHWQDWVRAGEETYQELRKNCQQVFLGGESMGGVLALYLASQYPEAAGLLLYSPAIRLTMSSLDIAKLYLGAPFIAQVERTSLDCSDKWQGYPGLPLKGAIQLLRFASTTKARLARIHQPVMVLQGRLDVTVAPSAGEIILNGVSSSLKEHHWMENSNHAITLDQELPQVTELTVGFIQKALSKS